MPYLIPALPLEDPRDDRTIWLGANWFRSYEVALDLTGAALKSEIRRRPAPEGQPPVAAFTMTLVSSTSTPAPYSVFGRELLAAAMGSLVGDGSYETDIYVTFPNPDVNDEPDDSGPQKLVETAPLVVVGNITQP